jgi:hypothetical protein
MFEALELIGSQKESLPPAGEGLELRLIFSLRLTVICFEEGRIGNGDA